MDITFSVHSVSVTGYDNQSVYINAPCDGRIEKGIKGILKQHGKRWRDRQLS